MLKKLLLFSFTFVSTCLLVTELRATSHCVGLDITFSNVTLTGVNNGMISYDITISNVGTQTIAFNKLTLKNYNSADNIYDGADMSGGSALFTSFAIGTSLGTGQQYTTSFHSNYSVNIKTIPYLILQLEYQDAECDASNNQIIACTRPNAVFNSLLIRNISANEADFDFEIQNTGGDTLFLPNLVLQSYVSHDNVYDGGDPAAGGVVMSFGGKQYLLANETYAASYGAYETSIASYAYVISGLTYSYTECNTSDNKQIQPMTVVAGNQQVVSDEASNRIIWDMVSHSFITKDQIEWSGNIVYQLFDTSGRLLIKGKVTPGERVYITEGSGLAILIVADEQHAYSQKILR